nr:hypothetical protein [Mycobacterium sp. 1245499.0]
MTKNFRPPDSSQVDDAVDISGLLTPLSVGSLRLPNRFALAPMTRYATPDGIPTAAYVPYFRRRAAGGLGLLITESALIPDPSTATDLDMLSYFHDSTKAAWKPVVEAVHDEGAAIFSQLLHAGVYRGHQPSLFPDVPTASPSGIDFYGEPIGAVTQQRGPSRPATALSCTVSCGRSLPPGSHPSSTKSSNFQTRERHSSDYATESTWASSSSGSTESVHTTTLQSSRGGSYLPRF